MLVPPGEWWTATFCADPGPEMYCDVCTLPEWNADGTVLHMVDLDLDVVRPHGGEAHIEDEEQFAEHRVRYGYPDSVVGKARQTCEWLMEAGRRGGEAPNRSPRRTATGSTWSSSRCVAGWWCDAPQPGDPALDAGRVPRRLLRAARDAWLRRPAGRVGGSSPSGAGSPRSSRRTS
ncbi:DUF402 domain-containing protein [Streptomyces sp. INA 01156]